MQPVYAPVPQGYLILPRPRALGRAVFELGLRGQVTRVDRMGRNKWNHTLSKAENKRVKREGTAVVRHQDNLTRIPRVSAQVPGPVTSVNSRGLAPRHHSQNSDNSWVHAILFVVLLVIVVLWALGY